MKSKGHIINMYIISYCQQYVIDTFESESSESDYEEDEVEYDDDE